MAYVVGKNELLFRAFPTREEALRYEQTKKNLRHEHCCVCHSCPNTSDYAQHTHYQYRWDIDSIPVESSNLQDKLFIVCRNRSLNQKTGFATHEEASTYLKKKKEEDSSNYWSIVICRYSPLCLYPDTTSEELETYEMDEHFHYQFTGKAITNAL